MSSSSSDIQNIKTDIIELTQDMIDSEKKEQENYECFKDFLEKETKEEKKEFCKDMARDKLILIREFMLMVWSHAEDDIGETIGDMTNEIHIINEIIYETK